MQKSIFFLPIITLVLSCLSCRQNNSSTAVLDKFYILDQSLEKNNQILTQNTTQVIADILETAKIKTQYLPLVDAANNTRNLARDIDDYINNIRKVLIKESGGIYSEEEALTLGRLELKGRAKGGNNKKIAHRIFITGEYDGKEQKAAGLVLEDMISDLKKAYLKLVLDLWSDGSPRGTIFQDSTKINYVKDGLEAKFPLMSSDYYKKKEHSEKSWSEYTFGDLPAAAIYPILHKIQNDIRISEAIVIDFLNLQTKSLSICGFGRYDVFSTAPKACIRLGETYKTKLRVGEFAHQTTFSISVNGRDLKIVDGIALYQTKPSSTGEKMYTANVSVVNSLTGETQTFTKEFRYEVLLDN